MDEQRPACMEHIVPGAEVDLLQRGRHVEHAAGVHVDAEMPQQASEDDQIRQEVQCLDPS
jgi:hypothetical protein